MDTFGGIDGREVSEREVAGGTLENNQAALDTGFYVSTVDAVRKNAQIVQGSIPDILPSVEAERVACLHIDMNNAVPEIAAIEFFWDRLVPGAFALLDDYAYVEYDLQKNAMDQFAHSKSIRIASLPTGQGLMMKLA